MKGDYKSVLKESVCCHADEPIQSGDLVVADPLRSAWVRKADFSTSMLWDAGVATTDQPKTGGDVWVRFGGVFYATAVNWNAVADMFGKETP